MLTSAIPGRASAEAASSISSAIPSSGFAALCSSAVRTQQTYDATGFTGPVRFSRAVYDATPGEILTEIGRTAADVTTLLVVGHAPGIPGLAAMLALPDSHEAHLTELSVKFPTSAIAVLTTAGSWEDLAATGATLTHFYVARA
nr:histidine phosphatase family protein [Nakamurella antarctica]